MKRILGHALSLLAIGLAVSAALPACAENDQSIFVRAVLAPSQNRQNGTCTYTDDPQQPQLLAGSADLGVRDNYLGILLVGNQMIPRGDPSNSRAESNRVHIEGGVVRVTDPNGVSIREFTSSAAGFADPQNNNTPDYGLIALTLIDAPTRDILLQGLTSRGLTKSVVVHVKVFGKSLGGTDIESDEFVFPLRVCNGCLVSFPAGTSDDTRPIDQRPNCLLTPAASGGTTTFPCFAGQDEVTPCNLCIGRAACDPKTP